MDSRPYLVETGDREAEAIRTLVGLPFIAEPFFHQLGIDPYFCWFVLFAKKHRLLPTAEGDIDILAGPLEWSDPLEFEARLAEERRSKPGHHESWPPIFAAMHVARAGGIKWPPTLEHMAAIEVKCAYLDPCAETISRRALKSTKCSNPKVRRIRGQVQSLLKMGFDRVALLDVIANPPVSGPDGGAWIIALDVADRSARAMSMDLANRLPEGSPVGQFVWSVGAVWGGNESWRGAGYPTRLRPSLANPYRSEPGTTARRQQMRERLHQEFRGIPKPLNYRVVLEDCGKCGKIHADPSPCAENVGHPRCASRTGGAR